MIAGRARSVKYHRDQAVMIGVRQFLDQFFKFFHMDRRQHLPAAGCASAARIAAAETAESAAPATTIVAAEAASTPAAAAPPIMLPRSIPVRKPVPLPPLPPRPNSHSRKNSPIKISGNGIEGPRSTAAGSAQRLRAA